MGLAHLVVIVVGTEEAKGICDGGVKVCPLVSEPKELVFSLIESLPCNLAEAFSQTCGQVLDVLVGSRREWVEAHGGFGSGDEEAIGKGKERGQVFDIG